MTKAQDVVEYTPDASPTGVSQMIDVTETLHTAQASIATGRVTAADFTSAQPAISHRNMHEKRPRNEETQHSDTVAAEIR